LLPFRLIRNEPLSVKAIDYLRQVGLSGPDGLKALADRHSLQLVAEGVPLDGRFKWILNASTG
jgi:hypothetical protein